MSFSIYFPHIFLIVYTSLVFWVWCGENARTRNYVTLADIVTVKELFTHGLHEDPENTCPKMQVVLQIS